MERHLSAILAADMVGFSRLMEADEIGTIGRQKAHRRELINPVIEQYHGRIVKEMGDGILVEFASVVDAVACALVIQRAMPEREDKIGKDRRIAYRVGINLGDVVVEGDDLFGDSVNVAARLEQLAEPGGICISGTVYDHIEGRSEFVSTFLGEQRLKNISRPVRAYRVTASADFSGELTEEVTSTELTSPTLPDKPTIAVLPFDNFSTDADQEFFADGIVEDLITALSRFPWLFVVARNSSFSYKKKKVPASQVSAELGVRYVVEGSVRSSKTRVRISVQLIEAVKNHHIWAENHDRMVGELFDVQDEITRSIVGVLIPALSAAERERSLRDNRPDLDAWRAYQKGLAYFYRPYSHDDHAKAREFFDLSVNLDRGFADAHAMIALMGTYALESGLSSYSATPDEVLAEAAKAARTAVRCEDGNALAHVALGRVCALEGDLDEAVVENEIAVRLNPNLAVAHYELGFSLARADRCKEAIECLNRAILLSPNDPSRFNFYLMKGLALYDLERFEDAIVDIKEAARLRPEAFWPLVFLAGLYSALGRLAEARTSLGKALDRKPGLNLEFFERRSNLFQGKIPHYRRRLLEDLSKVGLPE